MKLIEFKNWVDGLPKDFLEYEVVGAELGDDGFSYRLDKPIMSLGFDGDTKKIFLKNLFSVKEGRTPMGVIINTKY